MKKFVMLFAALFIGIIAAHADTKTINWIVDGSTYDTTTCTVGGDLILPSNPTKYGYTFQGWISYIPIEYIESTGTQWIDTGYYPNNATGIKTKVQILSAINGEGVVFGGASADNQGGMEYYAWNNKAGYLYGNDKRTGAPIAVNDIIEINWNRNSLDYSINNVQQSQVNFISQTFTSPKPIWIAHINRAQYINEVGKIKCFYFQIYDNGTLVHDMIPVLDPNGVACMYDKVSDTFFYNAGTGNFVAGPVIDE